VHVSQLANRFVKDAREVVKTGDIVSVRVVEVDLARGRIALTMKQGAAAPAAGGHSPAARDERAPRGPQRASSDSPPPGAMAAAFAKLRG
jgi:protein Tex